MSCDGKENFGIVEPNLVFGFGDQKLICRSPYDLYRGGQLLCQTESRILTVAGSVTYQIVVFSTNDRHVHFRSARTGKEVVTFQVDQNIESILITAKWGFVLLYGAGKLHLYSVNGSKIRETPWPEKIVRWTEFSSPWGFDFVACAHDSEELVVFEAFWPDKRTKRADGFSGVLGLGFDAKSERLIVVTETGDASAIKIEFAEPTGPA